MKKGFAIATFICGAMLSTVGQSQELTEQQYNQAATFAVNATAATLYHEVGHMLISQFQLPILGKEEDAADNIATVMLLAAEDDNKDAMLIDAANSFFYSNNEGPEEIEDAAMYDLHSLDLQRAFQVICLMVGSDAELFGDLADEVGIDPDRQESCAFDYEQIAGNWNRLNETFIAQGNNGQPITVSYEPATEEHEGAAELLKNSQLLETVAKEITDTIELRKPVSFVGRECGEENAYYDSENEEVIVCYEIVNLYFGQVAKDILENPKG
ncbi:DUF4344 domain-containing metallopeptidase [Maritalea porphyrae]|uniref:DUF4344 domain-containing metallopeptidase n=1 Tax=Maritalea porphyrae TaxID=880732 RepID=UPI0022AEFDA9|nr:DUF4344 domain-containing metallopeptidase [Maritalea porphyrae]MCZ4270952.1 DUF4344 domain-containing metallopeptidase [Maritalea porphyrae]